MYNGAWLLFGKLPQWNFHVNCHVNGMTFQSALRFQAGLSSLRVSCKRALTDVYFPLCMSCLPKEGRACLIDHRQWHLWYDILENKKFDVKKHAENIGCVYYCHKFDPFKCLVWRGLATPLGLVINCKLNTRVFDFKLIHPCSWIHMTLNSRHLPVQTHHNNFRLTLSNFFGEWEKSKVNYTVLF